jgi:GNS1/SUR4 family
LGGAVLVRGAGRARRERGAAVAAGSRAREWGRGGWRGGAQHGLFVARNYERIVGVDDSLGWFEREEWDVAHYLPAVYALGVVLALVVLKPRTRYSGGESEGGEKRAEPFVDAQLARAVYNAYQVLLNSVMAAAIVGGVYEIVGGDLTRVFTFGPSQTKKASLLAFGLYLHYNNKFLEYFDTFFMILAGSWRQVSFLHVLHHAIMGPAWYYAIVAEPDGQAFFGGGLNSVVHVIMYYYYLASGLKSARWASLPMPPKQSVTIIQLVQFVLVGLHAVWHWSTLGLVVDRKAPLVPGGPVLSVALWRIEIALVALMLWLFGDFFKETYLAPKAPKAPKAAKAD